MPFTDSHCHIDFTEFSEQLPQLLDACAQVDIQTIIAPAVAPQYWQRLLTSCQQTSPVRLLPSLGIHPWYLDSLNESDLNDLAQLVRTHHQTIVAVGEIGLDGVIAKQQNNMNKQQAFFHFQLELANQVNKPVIVHHRRCHQEIIQSLKKIPVQRAGVIHGFSGSYQQGMTYIEMGFKLGIGGTITYPRAEKTCKAVAKFPLTALVLETDAPAMPIFGEQGKNNSPLKLIAIFNRLAELRQESPAELKVTIEQNVKQLFALS